MARAPAQVTDFAQRFGLNLARRRIAAGFTQELLGEMAGLHRTAVSQLERGERVPRLDTVVKLAASLQVDTNTLAEGLIWVPPEVNTGSFEIVP